MGARAFTQQAPLLVSPARHSHILGSSSSSYGSSTPLGRITELESSTGPDTQDLRFVEWSLAADASIIGCLDPLGYPLSPCKKSIVEARSLTHPCTPTPHLLRLKASWAGHRLGVLWIWRLLATDRLRYRPQTCVLSLRLCIFQDLN